MKGGAAETGTAAAWSKVTFDGFGQAVLARGRVLGERALADAEHLVAGPKPGHGRADRLDPPRDLCRAPGASVPAIRSPMIRTMYGSPLIRCQTPWSTPAASTATSTWSSAIAGFDLPQREHLGPAIGVLDDRLHRPAKLSQAEPTARSG